MILFENIAAGSVLITLHGDVDMSNCSTLEAALARSCAVHDIVVLNLSRCMYIDSCGLGVILQQHAVSGNRLRVVLPATHTMRRVFDILQLDAVLDVTVSIKDALAIAS